MEKIQIFFPSPQLRILRQLAAAEDRPVSEIVRRAVDRHISQLSVSAFDGDSKNPRFPAFDGGRIRVRAEDLKAVIYEDDER